MQKNNSPYQQNLCFFLPESFTDDVAEISKGQLVDSQLLNSSATMEHLTGSQDKISNPSLSRPVSSADQAAPLSLLGNSVLIEPNPNSKFNKHTLAEHTPVKSVTSDILLPFEKTSPLWKILETTYEVFSRIPQMPHFMKLERYSLCQADLMTFLGQHLTHRL